jgi:hypothetical protein
MTTRVVRTVAPRQGYEGKVGRAPDTPYHVTQEMLCWYNGGSPWGAPQHHNTTLRISYVYIVTTPRRRSLRSLAVNFVLVSHPYIYDHCYACSYDFCPSSDCYPSSFSRTYFVLYPCGTVHNVRHLFRVADFLDVFV